jgi:hypothetical protein
MRRGRPDAWRRCLRASVFALAAACAASLPARAEREKPAPVAQPPSRFSVSTGFDFSSGKYGEPDATQVWYVPFNVKYEWRRHWIFRLTVPYLLVTSSGAVVTGGDIVAVSGAAGRKRTHEGLGDVIVGATYRLDPIRPGFPWVDFTTKLKIPTASEKQGLGTGEVDTTLQIDVTKPFGRLTPFGTVAFRFVGDPPDGDLTDTLSTSLGFDWRFAKSLSAGLYYGWRQTASRSLGDAHELVPFVSWKVAKHFTIGPYADVGLSTAAPDFGLGIQLGYKQ